MADEVDFAKKYMPTLDKATLAQWTKQYAPGTAPPPPPDPMAPALAAANAKPGVPPPAAPPPSLFDRKFTPVDPNTPSMTPAEQAAATRQPRNGDWAGHNEFQQKLALDKAQANLDGATFYDPKKAAPTAPGASGGAPVLVSKGGRTPASWTTQTQEGVKLSPETYRAANKADASERDAQMWAMRAGEQEADRDFAYLEQFSKHQETHANQLAERAAQQRARYEAQLGKLEKMTAAAEADEIDPHAMFQGQGGLASAFAAGIAVLGGAFGAALQGPGAENQGLKAVNNAIQRSIDAQKANASLHRQKMEDQRSLLGQMAKTFGDEREAEEAAWIVYLQKAKTDMAKNAAESKTDMARAKWRAGIALIDDKLAARFEKWDQLTKDRVARTQHDVNAPAQYAGGAGQPLDKQDRKEVQDIAEQMEKGGIPQAFSNLQDVDRTIDTLGNGEIEGQSWTADKIFGASPQLGKAIYGDQAVAGRQAMATIKNGIRKSIAGASLTEGEKVELDKQLEGAKDAASLRRVVESARQALSHRARNIMSNGSDKARAEYQQRFGKTAAEGGPFTAMPGKGTAPHVKEAK